MQSRLQNFLKKHNLRLVKKISKGFSSETFLVEDSNGKNAVAKLERIDSPRLDMAKREVANLLLANSAGIGPKLIDYDLRNRIILIEFIKGSTFNEWLFKQNPGKKELQCFLREIFAQAEKLDALGLDHGQLAGKGKNILVQNGKPVIIDFEKASSNRKCHNTTQLTSFLKLNPNSAITKRIKETLAKD